MSVDESAIPAPATGFATSRITTAQYSPFSSDGVGAFRINCSLSHMNFDDPLVFPGQVRATHLHASFGNTDVDAFSNNTSINTSGNSTCTGGIENRSAYWAPAMIDTATGRPINQSAGSELDRVNALQVYYKTGYRGVASNTVQNFPAGLRMVAGDARATSPSERLHGHLSLPQSRSGITPDIVPELCARRRTGHEHHVPPVLGRREPRLSRPQVAHGLRHLGPGLRPERRRLPLDAPGPAARDHPELPVPDPGRRHVDMAARQRHLRRPRRLLRPRRLVERLERLHLPARRRQLLPRRTRLPDEPARRRPSTRLTPDHTEPACLTRASVAREHLPEDGPGHALR